MSEPRFHVGQVVVWNGVEMGIVESIYVVTRNNSLPGWLDVGKWAYDIQWDEVGDTTTVPDWITLLQPMT